MSTAQAAVVDEQSPLLARPATGFSTVNDSGTARAARRPTIAAPAQTAPATIPTSSAVTLVPSTAPAPAAAAAAAPVSLSKADTDTSWGDPAGLHLRKVNDENLVIFRRAVGINSMLAGNSDSHSLEEGRREAMGMYASVLRAQTRKNVAYLLLTFLIYASHFSQIIIGASLTALGPTAGEHSVVITVLGAVNTVVAGVLALVKGQGLPERLRKDQAEFRRLQDWIEQTEALLAVGVIGRDRKEVGVLVQVAFKKYNAAKASVDNNVPENYVQAAESPDITPRRSPSPSPSPSSSRDAGPSTS